MIPQEKSEAVSRGLREAFGVTDCDDVRKIARGSSSQAFRIVIDGAPYLLKFITRGGEATAARQIAHLKAAANAGLTPQVRYASVEDRVIITGFVEAVPFSASEALRRVPATLRKLHALPPFEDVPPYLNTTCMFLMHEGPARDGLLQKFRSSNLMDAEEAEELLDWHRQLAAMYRRTESDMVPCHNDLFKPDNILFDGDRVWLVDWEAAFRNDRYADLAAVGCMLARSEAEEKVFLEEYFGAAPNPDQRARYFHMQQMVHLFYTMAFLLAGAAGGGVERDPQAPDYREFQWRMWTGEVELTNARTKVAYARAHWSRLRETMRQARDKVRG